MQLHDGGRRGRRRKAPAAAARLSGRGRAVKPAPQGGVDAASFVPYAALSYESAPEVGAGGLRQKPAAGSIAMEWELRLGYLIHDVSRLRRTLFDKWLAPLGITRSQWWVLAFLSRNDGMPQTELALELDVGKVALGALIDRLEEGGFVKRMPDKSDRRIKRIVLTPRSQSLIETLRRKNEEFNQSILAGIPREDIEVATQTLRAMKHNLLEGVKSFQPAEAGEDTAPARRAKKAASPAPAKRRAGTREARAPRVRQA